MRLLQRARDGIDVRSWLKRPFHANGSFAVHALTMSSIAFAYLARSVPGFALYAYAVSIDVPTGKPADDAAARHQVEHRHLLSHPHWRVVKRHRVAEHGDGRAATCGWRGPKR